ncbi:unnamed protein product [Wuchereria bancrofti]|uniref:Uncharacterized protein n=1 Tax=Wuchereria bancrofti TaxID=6293 RepID=A0A3P7GD70_WUCBA|nr:unnamed protein product [Wuchereria bancrofti]
MNARVQGPPDIVFSQMGISFDADKCNVALLRMNSFHFDPHHIFKQTTLLSYLAKAFRKMV